MYINRQFKQTALFIAMLALPFAACKKNSDSTTTTTDSTGSGYASDYSKSEREGNDVESIADVAANSGSVGMRMGGTDLSSCATVTNVVSGSGHLVTINFGPTNCACADGRNRRGKILVYYTGNYRDSGSVHTITYDGYYINDNQLTGSKTVTNMGTNASGQYFFTVIVNDTLNLGTGNGMVIENSSRTRTWIAGYSTVGDRSDDVYQITGTATLTRPNGYTVSVVVDNAHPLQMAPSCAWIESGVVTITNNQTGKTRSIDYGTGACDNEAQLTFNGHTYNITL